MSSMIRCTMAALLVVAFSAAAFGVDPDAIACKTCSAHTWGPRVAFTCALMGNLTFQDLFDPDNSIKVSDLVFTWQANLRQLGIVPCNAVAPADVTASLGTLASAAGSLTVYELFTKSHDQLPAGLIKNLTTLKNAGLMALTLVNRPKGADRSLTDTMAALLANPKFATFTFQDLYNTPATPGAFTYSDLCLISSAMDGVNLLRDEIPDIAPIQGSITPLFLQVGCCDRVLRKCMNSGLGNCNQCPAGSGICCLGSTWCPL